MAGQAASPPQVLVIGAGPTGLAAALALAHLGVAVRIVDKNPARSDKSKALGVQAGTLECLGAAVDDELVDQMIGAGRPTAAAWIHLGDGDPIRIDLSTIASRYPFILILAQSETEEILEQRLNRLSVSVERQTELVDIEETDSQVLAWMKTSKGEVEEARFSFAIGCDGAHSVVRRLLKIAFKGAAYTGDFILGDVALQWSWPAGSVQTFVSRRGVAAAFPMKGEQYRLILIPRERPVAAERRDIDLDAFRSIASELVKGQISIQSATWLTRFGVHHRIVERFQQGRVFLAGDAAHIHSPAGGQGMNTGIQDALNLAFKLKKVLAEESPLASLKDYERERLPVARQVLRGTDLVFRMGLLPENLLTAFARRTLLPLVVGSSFVQRRVVDAISEMAVARREIIRYGRHSARGLPAPAGRAARGSR